MILLGDNSRNDTVSLLSAPISCIKSLRNNAIIVCTTPKEYRSTQYQYKVTSMTFVGSNKVHATHHLSTNPKKYRSTQYSVKKDASITFVGSNKVHATQSFAQPQKNIAQRSISFKSRLSLSWDPIKLTQRITCPQTP
jgi:hypothetical protein